MRRHAALVILIAVELGSVVYTAIALHAALATSSSGDTFLVPLLTGLAMLAVYAALTWVAVEAGRGNSDDGDRPS